MLIDYYRFYLFVLRITCYRNFLVIMKFLIPELYACAKQGILPTYDSIDQDDTNQNRFKSFYGNTNLVHGRVIAAASSGMVEFGSLQYIVLCGLGGIVSCGKFNCN